jgi:two-component system, HptB-dependent secretion and biofilm response regulator
MLDINFRRNRIKAWNGGLPAGVIYCKKNASITLIQSTHLPLGVLSERSFKDSAHYFDLAAGDKIFMWSDGIHEARNLDGDMFGEERLLDIFAQHKQPDNLFDDILDNVKKFVGKGEQDDDLSFIEINMQAPNNVNNQGHQLIARTELCPIIWDMSFAVKPISFKVFDPLPFLLNILLEVPELRSFSGSLFTILTELYSNALEHGVLGLPASLKTSADGFAQYYRLREKCLHEVSAGFVRIYFTYSANAEGGTLNVCVEDSGAGFDFAARKGQKISMNGYSGRGIALVENLCKTVNYSGKGNKVDVVFEWVNDD